MTAYSILGDLVVSQAEARSRIGDLANLADTGNRKVAKLGLSRERVLTAEALRGFQTEASKAFGKAPASGRRRGAEAAVPVAGEAAALAADFTPIGLGKPLTVVIRHAYTGKHPKGDGLFKKSRGDIALVSAIRDFASFNAAGRAMNVLRKGVKAGTNILGPAAMEEGTPVVAYFPAVTQDSLIFSVDMAIDNFPDELFTKASQLFTGVGSLPIFLPAQGYLMAASGLVKMLGGLGSALWDGHPPLSSTLNVDFDMPGSVAAVAQFYVLCNNSFDPTAMTYRPGTGLIDPATNKAYAGDEPYVVVSLDGKQRDNLNDFAPTLISAAMMSKFFDMKDGAQASMDAALEAFGLLNDLSFRRRADELGAKLAEAGLGDEDKKALSAKRDALIKNIQTAAMKPAA